MDINRTFIAQHGIISTAQAKEVGFSQRQIDRLVANGAWVREMRGVYRLAAYPSTRLSRLFAAVIATNGVASHRSAAVNLGLGVVTSPRPEVTIPERRRTIELPAGRVYRSSQWDSIDQVQSHGIATTGVERTIFDCSWLEPVDVVERLAESAVRQELSTWEKITDHFDSSATRGRNGSTTLRAMLEARIQSTVSLSEFSLLVAQLLVQAGLPRPVLEYRICDYDGNHVLQADLAWPELNKAIECDGLAWHGGRQDDERDSRKRSEAMALGWSIQRVLWSMYRDEKAEVVDRARRFLAVPAPFPQNLETYRPWR